MSDLLSHLFTTFNIMVDDDDKNINQRVNSPKSNKHEKSKYITIINKSYKDILLTPDELSFLETLPSKKLEIILNINRNNRSCDAKP